MGKFIYEGSIRIEIEERPQPPAARHHREAPASRTLQLQLA